MIVKKTDIDPCDRMEFDHHAMLVVNSCHWPDDMAVRMRNVRQTAGLCGQLFFFVKFFASR